MSDAQKKILEKFSEALSGLSEKDQAYLLGRAEGMAEANESNSKKDSPIKE